VIRLTQLDTECWLALQVVFTYF